MFAYHNLIHLRNIIKTKQKQKKLSRANFRFLVACISTWYLSCMGFSFVNSSLYYLNKKRNFCNVSGVWTSENGTRFLVGSTSWNGSWSFRFYLKLKYQTGMYLMLISKYSKKDNLLKFIDQPRRNHRKHFWHRAHQNVKILSSNLRFRTLVRFC